MLERNTGHICSEHPHNLLLLLFLRGTVLVTHLTCLNSTQQTGSQISEKIVVSRKYYQPLFLDVALLKFWRGVNIPNKSDKTYKGTIKNEFQ